MKDHPGFAKRVCIFAQEPLQSLSVVKRDLTLLLGAPDQLQETYLTPEHEDLLAQIITWSD